MMARYTLLLSLLSYKCYINARWPFHKWLYRTAYQIAEHTSDRHYLIGPQPRFICAFVPPCLRMCIRVRQAIAILNAGYVYMEANR